MNSTLVMYKNHFANLLYSTQHQIFYIYNVKFETSTTLILFAVFLLIVALWYVLLWFLCRTGIRVMSIEFFSHLTFDFHKNKAPHFCLMQSNKKKAVTNWKWYLYTILVCMDAWVIVDHSIPSIRYKIGINVRNSVYIYINIYLETTRKKMLWHDMKTEVITMRLRVRKRNDTITYVTDALDILPTTKKSMVTETINSLK